MRILVTGASGFIGSALVPFLTAQHHQVLPLRRGSSGAGGAAWSPDEDWIDLRPAGRLDAVIHLAGESVAQRWTPAAKARISASREHGTRLLSEALAALPEPPRVLVGASAIGIYGDRGDELLDETSPPGGGFLAEVCQRWEAAADAARQRGIRVVHLRLGLVLGTGGGALSQMTPWFGFGLGTRFGSGRQYWSWIALDDLLAVFDRALIDDRMQGVVNAVAPAPVTNREFTVTLGRVLRRPAFLAAPRPAVKLLLGKMGEETLLASARVRAARLLEAGFDFRFPDLEPALRHMLGQPVADDGARQ